MKQIHSDKRKFAGAVTLLVVLTLVLALSIVFVFNVRTELTVQAGECPSASDFLLCDLGLDAQYISGPTEEMLRTPGRYQILISYCGKVCESSLQVVDTIAPAAQTRDLTVFPSRQPNAQDFITEIDDSTDVHISFSALPDMTQPGTQTVCLALTDQGGNTTVVDAKLTLVFDETEPVISGVQEIRNYLGQSVDYLAGVSVSDDLDPEVSLQVHDEYVDLTVPGTYPVVYSAQDACGNTAVAVTNLYVIHDTQAPEIWGVTARSLFQGSTIAYRSGIVVSDDTDPTPKLSVDSSQVDLSTPGIYPLIYTATDAAGNVTTAETTVQVFEKKETYVEEAVIYQAVDDVIAKIITEDMTVKEQVEAIYNWARYSFWYSGYSEKMDWKQAGYKLITSGYGDCFSFFAATKLVFERLGIPNMDVRRLKLNPYGTDHFWSMVSIDGGETYYYFDTTPYPGSSARFCLATDADLDWFSNNVHYGYFNRDKSKLPATPTTKP